jgi:hypothetical protein
MEHGPNQAATVCESVAERSSRARKYRQAAVLYFAYGVFYLARVIALGERSAWNLHGYPRALGWVMLGVGAVITVTFPIFIWRGVRWFTLALAVVVFVRSVYVFVQPNVAFFLGPFLVTAVTAWALARAAWDL